MASYFTPGVYLEDLPSVAPMQSASTSNGGFIGTAQRGKVNVPTFVTSWNSYLEKFAGGMQTPFLADSDLAYAVYGFFQNGGKYCYVIRTASETAACASCTSLSEEDIIINAKDEGAWGNNLKIAITANADIPANFDITVKLNDNIVETITNLSNDTTDDYYWVNKVNTLSGYITGVSGTLAAKEDSTFDEGADGIDDIDDNDYVNSLKYFDTCDDVNLIAIPGQTSSTVLNGITSYVDNRKDIFCVLDCPEVSTTESILALRKTLSCVAGELLYPWIKVVDPLSKSGNTRVCPPSGHMIGVIARIISSRGVWKAPAGTEAVLRGALETINYLSQEDTDQLNPAGIVSLLPKPNIGVVAWGARSISPDPTMKYVSDILLDIYIKKTTYNNTQSFVFEPNSQETWSKITVALETFLDTLWREGGLFGESASDAYYVKCDADLNTESVRNQGIMITEVGYASKKPAEFVVFRFNHNVANA